MKAEHWLLLVAIAIVGNVCFYVLPNKQDFRPSVLGDLTAGLTGALVTALMVDRVIEAREDRERKRLRQLALRQLAPVFTGHVHLIAQWVKASSEKPERFPTTIAELLSRETLNNLRYLDFSKQAPTHPTMSWLQYSSREFERLDAEIERLIDRYASVLGSEDLTALEELRTSSLTRLVRAAVVMPELDQQSQIRRSYNILYDTSVMELVYNHAKSVQKVSSIMREVADPETGLVRIWMDDMAPQWMSARWTERYGPTVQAGSGGPPIHVGVQPRPPAGCGEQAEDTLSRPV